MALFLYRSVGIEERELFKIYNILTGLSVALCEYRHPSDDVSACRLDKLFYRAKRMSSASAVSR